MYRVMRPKDAERTANSVDADETRSSMIWVCTVCPDLYLRTKVLHGCFKPAFITLK